jgi:proteic killer suppression protein
MLRVSRRLNDIRSVPGNRLQKWEDRYSIRVNDQWRITFLWDGDGAHEVSLTDYH